MQQIDLNFGAKNSPVPGFPFSISNKTKITDCTCSQFVGKRKWVVKNVFFVIFGDIVSTTYNFIPNSTLDYSIEPSFHRCVIYFFIRVY